MATINENFFAALLDEQAAKWSAGVSFDRSNPLPLDQWSVFKDEDAALEYLTNPRAYPGQFIAYADETGIMVPCVLTQNSEKTALELKKIGAEPVDLDGTIIIYGGKAPTEEDFE